MASPTVYLKVALYLMHLLQSVEPTDVKKSTEATQDPHNSAKNRYANIPACESLTFIEVAVLSVIM